MNNKKLVNRVQDLGALIALILLVIVIGIISPEFRTISNFLSLLRQSSINGFIAFGMTCVILTGGIDLSVGSVLALSTALCAGFIAGYAGGTCNAPSLSNWYPLGSSQRCPCDKRKASAFYRNLGYYDSLPWTDNDLHGWKADF